MNQAALVEVWNEMAGHRLELVDAFYERLFELYPEYRPLFPTNMDHQMEKMVEMIGAVVRFSNNTDLIRDYLNQVGKAHELLHLTRQDLQNFKNVFVEAAAVACPQIWRDEHRQALTKTFDELIIPVMEESLGL